MAISTTEQVLHDGERNAVMQFTAFHDGVGGQESEVVKVDVSSLSPPPASVKVTKVEYDVNGGVVRLLWGSVSPAEFLVLSGAGIISYEDINGLKNDTPGKTGDILFSTEGFGVESSYSVKLSMIKKYG